MPLFKQKNTSHILKSRLESYGWLKLKTNLDMSTYKESMIMENFHFFLKYWRLFKI